jgi:XTP/dITP diphosphohydrolase
MHLLVATTNPGKVREIQDVLGALPITLLTLTDVPPVLEPDENGVTFAANAAIKARAYAASGWPTVAEDSGLAIDALDGRPGVESARYPGETYADKFTNLYRELASHPRPWTARFVCSLAFLDATDADRQLASGESFVCEATVEGEIAASPAGSEGFGYDPIFYYPPWSRTLGDVERERKLTVAHRGHAFRLFRDWLETRVAKTRAR